jgi:hypothetical protein
MMKKIINLIVCMSCTLQFGIAQNWDINTLKTINGQYTESVGKPMYVVTESITPVAVAAPLGIFLAGVIKKDDKLKQDSYTIAAAQLFSSVITVGLKLGVDRPRPFVTYPKDITKYSKAGSHSFPSGHTSMAFNVATAVTLCYPKWYVYVPAYLWAGSVGYSRMYLGVHYPSDVLVGALIGSGTAILTEYGRKYMEEKRNKKVESQF